MRKLSPSNKAIGNIGVTLALVALGAYAIFDKTEPCLPGQPAKTWVDILLHALTPLAIVLAILAGTFLLVVTRILARQQRALSRPRA